MIEAIAVVGGYRIQKSGVIRDRRLKTGNRIRVRNRTDPVGIGAVSGMTHNNGL